jgi:hypothetical protein
MLGGERQDVLTYHVQEDCLMPADPEGAVFVRP